MMLRHAEIAAWLLTGLLIVMTGARLRAEPSPATDDPSWLHDPERRSRVDRARLDRAAQLVVDRDLFRLERRPSPIPYDPSSDGAVRATPQPPKPRLVLIGLVGGPPWDALVEGFPMRSGSVLVRRGDVIGDSANRLTVVRLRRDTVVIVGMDTTWVLTLRRAWQ